MVERKDVSLSRIGVLILGVRDLGVSTSFYRERLGLPLRGTAGEFDAGGVTLNDVICAAKSERLFV